MTNKGKIIQVSPPFPAGPVHANISSINFFVLLPNLTIESVI